MKRVTYVCDWCGHQEPEREEGVWPNGWADHGNDEMLCGRCRECLARHVNAAVINAKIERAKK